MSISLRDIPLMFAFRVLPFAAYVCMPRTVPWMTRLSVWSIFAVSILLAVLIRADLSAVLIGGPLALIYFATVSLALHEVHLRLGRGPITNLVILVVCGAAYVLVPAVAIPRPAIIATVLVGWEAMLSAFSYWIDAAKAQGVSTRSDCLFFVLVNPSLVYSDRGFKTDGAFTTRSALPRVMLGVAAWNGQAVISRALQESASGMSGGAFPVLLIAGTAGALYFSHSGLASVQIGLARMVGHRIPERYAYPFLARSPEDFWRRWNRYLGGWARKYVFMPAALALGSPRRGLHVRKETAACAGLLLSFLSVGLLHEYAFWVQIFVLRRTIAPSFRVTCMFLLFGVITLAWRAVGERAKRETHRFSGFKAIRLANGVVQTAALLCVASGMTLLFVSCAGWRSD